MRKHYTRKGGVLIVVLGVLAVLALVAVSFNTVVGIDRSVARSYVDGVRARLIARAGVEHALAQLAGTDFLVDQRWVYSDTAVLEDALKPSFFARDPGTGAVKTIRVDGVARGYSDAMSSSAYGLNTDVYSVRVTDVNAQVSVNDGSMYGNLHPVSMNTKRMLRILGILKGVPATLTDQIVDLRPVGGYRSKYEVLSKMNNDLASFNRIKDYITVHAWQDSKVAVVVPLSDDPSLNGDYSAGLSSPMNYQRNFRYGRDKSARSNVNAPGTPVTAGRMKYYPRAPMGSAESQCFGMDELNPQWIEITSRAPINLNGASRDVLTAALSHLRGFFLVERETPPASPRGNPSGDVVKSSPWTDVGSGVGRITDNGTRTSGSFNLGHMGVWSGDPYASWLLQRPNYDGGPFDEDYVGLLVATKEIKAPTGPVGATYGAQPNDAVTIASEIIACRERRPGGFAGTDYQNLAFGGPFRNWAQFGAFVDNLVTVGAIMDDQPGLTSGQRTIAKRALGDVLKANANPNLHLNELNPDANLALMVDKTDLIVSSTEFCFYPTGRFEVESLGRCLRREEPPASPPNHLTVGESKVVAAVSLWECYRETSQKSFYADMSTPLTDATRGHWTDASFKRPALTDTGLNSNYVLEAGPEADNGRAAREADYAGYLAFSTVGGVDRSTATALPDGRKKTPADPATGTAPSNSPPTVFGPDGEWLRANYQFDFDANLHVRGDKFRFEAHRSQRGRIDYEETADNHGDNSQLNVVFNPNPASGLSQRTWSAFGSPIQERSGFGGAGDIRGPYDPTWGPAADPPRLCKQFPSLVTGGTTAAISMPRYTLSDLRVDGVYSERNSAPGYVAMNGIERERTVVTTTEQKTVSDPS